MRCVSDEREKSMPALLFSPSLANQREWEFANIIYPLAVTAVWGEEWEDIFHH
jgi:hypothetical protein